MYPDEELLAISALQHLLNCLLSFLYAMLAHDARSAREAVGLDAAVGFLHRDRPGRPGLTLDLMEEFRAFLVDRLALSLINRRQVSASGFQTTAIRCTWSRPGLATAPLSPPSIIYK